MYQYEVMQDGEELRTGRSERKGKEWADGIPAASYCVALKLHGSR